MAASSLQDDNGPDPFDVLEHLLRTLDVETVQTAFDPLRDMVKRFAREAGRRGHTLESAEAEIRGRMAAAAGRMAERRKEWLTERLLHTCRTWYR